MQSAAADCRRSTKEERALATTRAQTLFSSDDIFSLLVWFVQNPAQIRWIKISTIDGKVIDGPVVQLTNNYCAVSLDDQHAENDFSGTIIPLSAITSIQFALQNASGDNDYGGWSASSNSQTVV